MWYYNNKIYNELHDKDLIGFVYQITDKQTGKKYIGKKNFFQTRKTKLSKKKKEELNTKRTHLKLTKESNWQNYKSSHQELKKLPEESLKKEIISFHYSKRDLTYHEAKYQFENDVIHNDNYLNQNILGKFY